MGTNTSIPLHKHIVIVGGGYAGIHLALNLMSRDCDVTLIDCKKQFVHYVAAVRAIVEPSIVDDIYLDYEKTFKGHYKQGYMVAVEPDNKEVHLKSGERVKYDILVIATGCDGQFPYKPWNKNRDEAKEMYERYYKKLESCQRIAIIGGGAVGVEIAGEIATDFKGKEVSLFHPDEELLRKGLSNKFQTKLRGILQRLNVKLYTGQKVSNLKELEGDDGPFTLQTSTGETFEVDHVIKCIGSGINYTAFTNGLADSMDEAGALKVNKYLEVEGHDNIFAIGDCTNVEAKIALLAINQSDCVFENIRAKLLNQPLLEYKKDNIPIKMVLSVGRSSGLGELKNGFVLPEIIVTNLKSKSLFVSKYKGIMKQ